MIVYAIKQKYKNIEYDIIFLSKKKDYKDIGLKK